MDKQTDRQTDRQTDGRTEKLIWCGLGNLIGSSRKNHVCHMFLVSHFFFVRKWSIKNESVQSCCKEPRLLCVSCFPFLFVRKWLSKNKSVQWCCEEPLLYEIGKGSHFFSLRNQDGSNYLFADDVKNHVCLVSPAQSKKNPKCPLRQSQSRSYARAI